MGFFKRFRAPRQVEVYADASGKWRWRAVARNGRIVDAAEQGYSTKRYALTKAERYAEQTGCPTVVVTGE